MSGVNCLGLRTHFEHGSASERANEWDPWNANEQEFKQWYFENDSESLAVTLEACLMLYKRTYSQLDSKQKWFSHLLFAYFSVIFPFKYKNTILFSAERACALFRIDPRNHYVFHFSSWIWIEVFRKGHDLWPSMVSHTQNLYSVFNPSKCTHSSVRSEHTQLKGLTSVVVLRVKESTIHPRIHLQSLTLPRFEPAAFGLQVQLSYH